MITIRLLKPFKDKVVTYQAEVLQRSATLIVVRAEWTMPLVDLGYITFAPGDQLREYFYSDRWYNVYQVRTATGMLKGWYCNITRPAVFGANEVESEDLELDLFVAANRQTVLLLDEDEYAARGLERDDPTAHQAALAALAELRDYAQRGVEPFTAHE